MNVTPKTSCGPPSSADSGRFTVQELKTTMAKYVNKKWEAYETSHERDFIYRPILSVSIRPKTSGGVIRSSLDDPVGATVYSEDFCWRPVPKTACIRSATASGNRRNNPHPSKAFMIWRHSADQMKPFDGSSPLQLCFTEKEIQKALSDQYRSTYKSDFLGLPQVIMKKHAFIVPFNHNQAVHYFTQTEMRHSYRSPIIKPELLGNTSRYGCNKLHGVAARGIVDHSRINNKERSKLQSTYNKHFGRKYTDVSAELTSVPPETVLQFCKTLSNKEKKEGNSLHINNPSAYGFKLERMSAWPGPL